MRSNNNRNYNSIESKVSFGIFLILIGTIWILIKFNILTASVFKSFLTLWPLLLVGAGMSIIFHKQYIIRLLSWLLILAVVVGYGYVIDNDGDMERAESSLKQSITSYSSDYATLEMNIGAVRLDVNSSGTVDVIDIDTNITGLNKITS